MNPLSTELESCAANLTGDDDARTHLVCIRPAGPFSAFDERLMRLATRYAETLRLTVFRSWDFAAQHERLGFVSATVPTLVVIRFGTIVAKSMGDLPRLAIEELIHAAAQ
jgi:hypothetical protein